MEVRDGGSETVGQRWSVRDRRSEMEVGDGGSEMEVRGSEMEHQRQSVRDGGSEMEHHRWKVRDGGSEMEVRDGAPEMEGQRGSVRDRGSEMEVRDRESEMEVRDGASEEMEHQPCSLRDGVSGETVLGTWRMVPGSRGGSAKVQSTSEM